MAVPVETVCDPLNDKADIRAELGRLKEQNDITWDDPTNRTIYQWSESSGTEDEPPVTKTSV